MLTVRTYDKLNSIVNVFAGGKYNLFILLGDPGHAKSRTMKAAVAASGHEYVWIKNTASAFRLYIDLYHQSEAKLLVIDDVDSFYTDRGLVRLLKCLCESETLKTLSWHTDAAKLDKEEVPREYQVNMRVAIIANVFRALNKNIGALEDRGHVVRFEPGVREVHANAGTWFDDPEIYQFVGERLHQLKGRLSLRDYKKAAEDKAGGLDWRAMFLEDKQLSDDELILQQLAATPFPTEERRAEEYRRRTGASRATYFRRKKGIAAMSRV